MATTVRCSRGHKLVITAEPAPPRVRCSKCGEIVAVPADLAPPTIAAEDEEGRDGDERRLRRQRRQLRQRRQGLEKVNLGLACHYARLLLLVVTILGWIILMVLSVPPVAGAARGRGVLAVLRLGPDILTFTGVVQSVVAIVGSILCLVVPARGGLRGVVLACLLVDAGALVSFLFDLTAGPGRAVVYRMTWPDLLGVFMGLTSWILFTFFLRQLADYLGEVRTAGEAMEILWRGLVLFVAGPIVLSIGSAALHRVPCVGQLIYLAVVVAYLVFVIRFLLTILDVIGSLRSVIVRRELGPRQPETLAAAFAGVPSHLLISGAAVGVCCLTLALAWLISRRPATETLAGPPAVGQEPATNKTVDLKRSEQNLKQIGLAFHNYSDSYRRLPRAAITGNDGAPLLSWRVALLPFLGEDTLHRQFKLTEPWDSEHNRKLLDRIPAVYAPPAVPGADRRSTYYQVFTGAGTLFEQDQTIRFTDIADGTSFTVLAVEAGQPVPWTKPEDLPFDADKPLPRLGGLFRGTFHVLLADGTVRPVRTSSFNERVFRRAVTRNDGQRFDINDLDR